MNSALVRDIYQRLDALPILDTHTHVDWKTGTASNIGEILSYHYYTEMTNSAKFKNSDFPSDPEVLTRRILPDLALIRNTVQYDWLMTISREYLQLHPSEWRPANWQYIFDCSVEVMGRSEWRQEMIAQSHIVRVFLTNQYDDDLEGLDTAFYTPCLRIEPFVLGMGEAADREKMAAFLGRPIRTTADFEGAIDMTFGKFVAHGMGYAAMSIPAGFKTFPVLLEDARRLLDKATAGTVWTEDERQTWGAYAMNCIAEACRKFGRPFHLMIGVNREAYAQGDPKGGRDLFDSVNSMRGYDYLLNTYWDVRFPVAVLADTTGLELTAAAWIRHNVYPSGHWWFSNQPTDIAREIRRRLNAVPGNKIIGYFSDAYYLEFILPKFRMYKFELASALAERMAASLIHPNMEPFTLDDAMVLAENVLVKNPARIMGIKAS